MTNRNSKGQFISQNTFKGLEVKQDIPVNKTNWVMWVAAFIVTGIVILILHQLGIIQVSKNGGL